jgi:hypothetical protein
MRPVAVSCEQNNGLSAGKEYHNGLNRVCSTELVNVVRFEVFTAVTMKNIVFWDIKPQFVLHRRHITSLLQSTDN